MIKTCQVNTSRDLMKHCDKKPVRRQVIIAPGGRQKSEKRN